MGLSRRSRDRIAGLVRGVEVGGGKGFICFRTGFVGGDDPLGILYPAFEKLQGVCFLSCSIAYRWQVSGSFEVRRVFSVITHLINADNGHG